MYSAFLSMREVTHMLTANQHLLNSILVLPLSQLSALCAAPDEEGAYDFLAWLYDSLAQTEADYSADIETPADIIDLLLTLATHYEPTGNSNTYQERLERRRAYYEELAEKRQRESNQEWATAGRMGQAIPFGQPILVGHYSENADRRYRDRIWNKMGKAVALADTAKYHAARAARIGNAGISGDDPNKIIKLRRKLAQAQHLQEQMKAANQVIKRKRKGDTDAQKLADLQAMGYSPTAAAKLLLPDFANQIGFAAYQISNNNAEIRRITDRITQEQANQQAAETPDRTYTLPNGDRVTVTFDATDNRIRVCFPGKPFGGTHGEPDEATRATLSQKGFNWSPSNKAWQRQITANARYALLNVIAALGMQPQ